MKPRDASTRWTRRVDAAVRLLTGSAQARDCDQCAGWELRFLVALHATYYLALHIREIPLREAVLDDVTSAWALCIEHGGHPDGFQGLFADYCTDVERDMDPALRNTMTHTAECRRVWRNHAAILSGRQDLVEPRTEQVA